MKLGFWTRGMPPWSTAELARRAAKLGYQGVDLRCTRPVDGKPSDGGNISVAATAEEIDRVVGEFAGEGVEIASLLCYNKGGHGAATSDWPGFEEDVRQHAVLAERLGAPRIRVTVGHPEDGDWDAHLVNLWGAVGRALDGASGVGAVFENHPGSANAEQLLEMAERRGDPRLGAHFSPDHTLVMQEDTIGLIERYGPHIHQVCFADRKPVAEDLARFDGQYYYVRYETVPTGEGIVPAAKIFPALRAAGYAGYVSLKWEKSPTYGHNLPDGEVALEYFPRFMAQFDVP